MGQPQCYNNEADSQNQIYLKLDPALAPEPQFHDSIEFVIIAKGKVEAHCDDASDVLTEGQIFFAESYETHYYKALSDEVSAYVLVFSREFIASFRNTYPGLTFPTFMKDVTKNQTVIRFVKEWITRENKLLLYNMGATSLFLALLCEQYPLIKRHDYSGDVLLKELLRYIHMHYLEDITLKSMSNNLGYTVEHCSKTLSQALGCNFREYINSLRLRKAKELMNDKSLNLTQSEILYACGFTSSATFYRVKKQLMNDD